MDGEPGEKPKRKSGGSYRAPPRGERGHTELSGLFTHWKAGAPGFARPAPPAEPPLPLRFTCGKCGGSVDPESGQCADCKTTYDF